MTDPTTPDPDLTHADVVPARRSGAAAALPALLLALAALCLWAASRMTWVRVESFDGLGEARTTNLIGGTWAAATTPLALALLAAIAASFALHGWALRVVAVLVALVAIAAAVPALQLLFSDVDPARAGRLAELPDRATVTATQTLTGPAVLATVGGVAALAAAVFLWRKASAAKGLSGKYTAPAARREEAARRRAGGDEPSSQRELWDALDSGVDPTDDTAGDDIPDEGTDTRR